MPQYGRLVAVGCLFIVAACAADSTSPGLTALDGPWSTAHTLVGLDMAVSLTWTNNAVSGTGSYALADDTLRCGAKNVAIPGGGSVTFTATRSADQVNGSLQFVGGVSIPFDGALIDSSHINGELPRMEGTIQAPDGTKCLWGMFRGLVP